VSSYEVEVLVTRDCLGGDRIVELRLQRPVQESDLDRVNGVTERVVLHQLPRPFFRLDVPGKFLLTGIVGDPRLRFTVRLAVRDDAVGMVTDVARRMIS
jgi:hypothetical protein